MEVRCSISGVNNNIIMTALLLGMLAVGALAQQCGRQAGGALCPNRLCCSQFGYCGNTDAYCGAGCQSQCTTNTPTPTNPTGDITSLFPRSRFEEFLKHRSDGGCPGGFYTYDAFIAAARTFPGFLTTGDQTAQKREVAAFFGQTSHETTGGWPSAPDGPFAWGYCYIREINQAVYCTPGQWPCAPGQKYYGRGPIQLTHNYNYGQAGTALGLDLINNPDQVATNAVTSFRAAIWFWMTPQGNKPSCHDVATGRWTPSAADRSANRYPGYGVITNIINGALECGRGYDSRVADRIGFYKRYCDILGIGYGDNLDCYSQRSF